MPSTSQHIFLASRYDEESRAMRRAVEPLTGEFYPLHFVMTRPHALQSLVESQSAAIVIQTQDWGAQEIKWVEGLRNGGFQGLIVMIVKNRIETELKEVFAHQPIVFLERSFEGRELKGVLHKYLSARIVQQQVYRRFATSQMAELEFSERDLAERLASKVTNLSKGGAYLELKTAPEARVGETVQLKMHLNEVNRSYTMAAKVVWTKSAKNGEQGIGLIFLGPGNMEPLSP